MKYYNVIVLILIILIIAVCTTGCGPLRIKTQHHITLDHNITINMTNPVIVNINHKHYHYDSNKTRQKPPGD